MKKSLFPSLEVPLSFRNSEKLNLNNLNNYTQLLKNSGYSKKFGLDLLRTKLQAYNRILEAERDGVRPVHRPKGWKESARWLEMKEEEHLAWKFLLVVQFCAANTRFGIEEENARKRGGNEEVGARGIQSRSLRPPVGHWTKRW